MNRHHKVTSERVEQFRQVMQLKDSLTPREISERLGVAQSTVYTWITKTPKAYRQYIPSPTVPVPEVSVSVNGTGLIRGLKDKLLQAAVELEDLEGIEEQIHRLEKAFKLIDQQAQVIQTMRAKMDSLDKRLRSLMEPVNSEGSLTGR